MATSTENYKSNYGRIAHLASDKMKSLHKYLAAETDNFTDWGDAVSNRDLAKQITAHFKQIDELYKSVNTDEGYSGRKFEGSAYRRTQNLDIKEIAKLIREELAIQFPGCKFSVTIDRYSGGQSIDVSILDVDFDPLHANLKKALATGNSYNDYVRDREYFNGGYNQKPVYNDAYDKFTAKVKSIISQYNMDDSDSQSDYFHVRFYSNISRLDVPLYLARQADPNYEQKQKASSKANREQQRKEANARKQKRSEQYGDFQKGELVYWVAHYSPKSGHFQKGEPILGKIIKAPNGRGFVSYYKLGLYFPVGSAPVKHRQGAPALTHKGVGYYYYGNYDYGTKENLRSLAQIEQPKTKRKASLKAVRNRAAAKPAATAARKSTATKKASTAKAKRKPSRETVTATLDTYRTAAKKSTAVKAKSRLRQETGTTGATRRSAKPAPVAPASKPKAVASKPVSKPKTAPAKAARPKAKRKPCKTSKQTLQRISRLEATNKKLRSELATDERLIKKVHRQTKR